MESQNSTLASTCTRICFRAYVLDESKSSITVLKSVTEPIRCGNNVSIYLMCHFSSTIGSSWSAENVSIKCSSVSHIFKQSKDILVEAEWTCLLLEETLIATQAFCFGNILTVLIVKVQLKSAILEGTIGWSADAAISKPYFHQVRINYNNWLNIDVFSVT